MVAYDLLAQPAAHFSSVCIDVYDEGKRTRIEFPTETLKYYSVLELPTIPANLHRGVYGYVAFGLYPLVALGASPLDGCLEDPHFAEGRFVNWKRNIFFPPVDYIFFNLIRVWMRDGVDAGVYASQVFPVTAGTTNLSFPKLGP